MLVPDPLIERHVKLPHHVMCYGFVTKLVVPYLFYEGAQVLIIAFQHYGLVPIQIGICSHKGE